MTSKTDQIRRTAVKLTLAAACLWLAACDAVPTITRNAPRVDATKPVAVALLVPSGSGQATDAALAKSLENAARLAIGDLQGVQIDLRVYSTAGKPGQASAMATKAADEGAKIIIGPVFAQAANAAGVAVAGRGINVLSFSNNTDIAGRNVFVLGNTFENTADRLVRYAVAQGKTRVMIVNGKDAGEDKGRAAIAAAIASSGATTVGSASYDLTQAAVINAVPGIARTIKSTGADAVFLTSGTAGALPLLSQLLPENGVSGSTTQLVGLQRWDIPASAMALPGLQGGWFALPSPGLNRQFQARYSAAYGQAPHPIAGLAYDGIAAIGALVKSGNANALSAASLTQGTGFAGVNGIFRLRADGTNQRGLAIAQLRNNQVVVIDPAPRSFGGAGF